MKVATLNIVLEARTGRIRKCNVEELISYAVLILMVTAPEGHVSSIKDTHELLACFSMRREAFKKTGLQDFIKLLDIGMVIAFELLFREVITVDTPSYLVADIIMGVQEQVIQIENKIMSSHINDQVTTKKEYNEWVRKAPLN